MFAKSECIVLAIACRKGFGDSEIYRDRSFKTSISKESETDIIHEAASDNKGSEVNDRKLPSSLDRCRVGAAAARCTRTGEGKVSGSLTMGAFRATTLT